MFWELPQIGGIYGHYGMRKTSVIHKLLCIFGVLSDQFIDWSNKQRVGVRILQEPQQGRFGFARACRERVDYEIVLLKRGEGINLVLEWTRQNPTNVSGNSLWQCETLMVGLKMDVYSVAHTAIAFSCRGLCFSGGFLERVTRSGYPQ